MNGFTVHFRELNKQTKTFGNYIESLMTDFYTESKKKLEEVADFFEYNWTKADVDLLEDSVTAFLPEKKQYVINKHGITHQIWLSSPFTGAHHFMFYEGAWVCTRTGREIDDILYEEHETYAS